MAMAYQKDYQYQKSLDHFQLTFDQIYNPDLLAKLYLEKANTLAGYGKYYGFRDATGKLSNEKFEEATQTYLKALETKPDYNEVLLTLAQHYETNLKDPRLALYYYEKYYKTIDPLKAMPHEVEWLERKISKLKEDVHFIGD